MPPVGYQEGNEKLWWWKVAQHLDDAQLALANAMAHNLDDHRLVIALQDRLREGQAILLDIFRAKGLLPGSPNGSNGAIEHVPPVMSEPAVPEQMIVDAELIDEPPAPQPVQQTSAEDQATSSPAPIVPSVSPTEGVPKPDEGAAG